MASVKYSFRLGSSKKITKIEHLFVLSFSLLVFSLFSCAFPAGLINFFLLTALVFGILITRHLSFFTLNLHEKLGLALFGWLILSTIINGHDSLGQILHGLYEYRFFILLPLFTFFIANCPLAAAWGWVALVGGCCFALMASYLLGFKIILLENAHLSLGNHIFHGFIMVIFSIWLVVSIKYSGLSFPMASRWLPSTALFLSLMVVIYNVLFVEVGRTAYVSLVLVLSSLSILVFEKKIWALRLVGILVCLIVSGYHFDFSFKLRVDRSVDELLLIANNTFEPTSFGLRFEYYRVGLTQLVENPILGVGLPNLEGTLASLYENGQMRHFTDNLHGEFLNLGVAAGLPAIVFFILFLLAIPISVAKQNREECSHVWIFACALVVLIFIHSLVNSTLKDFGEKHVLLVVIALICSGINPWKSVRDLIAKPLGCVNLKKLRGFGGISE